MPCRRRCRPRPEPRMPRPVFRSIGRDAPNDSPQRRVACVRGISAAVRARVGSTQREQPRRGRAGAGRAVEALEVQLVVDVQPGRSGCAGLVDRAAHELGADALRLPAGLTIVSTRKACTPPSPTTLTKPTRSPPWRAVTQPIECRSRRSPQGSTVGSWSNASAWRRESSASSTGARHEISTRHPPRIVGGAIAASCADPRRANPGREHPQAPLTPRG